MGQGTGRDGAPTREQATQRRHSIRPGSACGTPTGTATPTRIPVARHVRHVDPAFLAADAHRDRPPVSRERLQPLARCRLPRTIIWTADPCRDLVGAQVAQPAQEVVHRVGRPRGSVGRQELELQLELGQGVGVEQLAQLLGTQQLAQQVAIEGQRLRPPVDQRRVALVHVRGDVVEHQRAGERRRAARLHADQADLAPLEGRARMPCSAGRSNTSWRHSR